MSPWWSQEQTKIDKNKRIIYWSLPFFYFPTFSPASSNNGGLICTGAVTAYKGYLSLTSEPFPGSPDPPLDKVGRVLYHHPVLAWPASITTIFTIRISKYSNSTDDSGDGMTFIFAPNSNPLPFSSYGSNLMWVLLF